MTMRNKTIRLASSALLLATLAGTAAAQTVTVQPPNLTGTQGNTSVRYGAQGPLVTLTAVGPSTVNSADQSGPGRNVSCDYVGTAHTGTEAVTVSLQGKVPGGTTYYTLLTSASITTEGTTTLSLGSNITTATNVGLNHVLPITWRVQVVLGTGTSPTTTATVSCVVSD